MGGDKKIEIQSVSNYCGVDRLSPEKYELSQGTMPGAPSCPFVHRPGRIGFDKEEMKIMRVTKSVL